MPQCQRMAPTTSRTRAPRTAARTRRCFPAKGSALSVSARGFARLVELVHPADLRPGRDAPGVAREENDRDRRHHRPEAEPEAHPREERQSDDALGDADGERVHEGRGEAGVGPDEGDAAGEERVVAERAGEEEERREEDERLLGDADRPAADGEDDGEERHDERLPPAEPPDERADAGLDDARPVEDAEGAADDEDVEDDLGDLERPRGKARKKRADPGRPGLDGMIGQGIDDLAALLDDAVVAPGRDDPGRRRRPGR